MTRLRQHDIKNKTNAAIQIAEAVQDNVATGARFASGAYDGLDISILAGWCRVMDVGWGFTKGGTKCVSHCSIIDFSHVKNICNHNVSKKHKKNFETCFNFTYKLDIVACRVSRPSACWRMCYRTIYMASVTSRCHVVHSPLTNQPIRHVL